MNIFDILKDDHNRVKVLLNEIISIKEKDDSFDDLLEELTVHMEGEEKHFYPALDAAGMTNDILEAKEEHHVMKVLLNELDRLSDSEKNWLPKVKVLKENVIHHIKEEEDKIFSKAKNKLDEAQLEKIANKFQDYKSAKATM